MLTNNKQTVSFLLEISKLLIIITGAIAAYLRFFKGHLFLSKIEFQIKHKMIRLSGTNKRHFLDIEIKNIGDYTVYNPTVYVNVFYIPEVIEKTRYFIKDGKGRINDSGKHMNHVLRAKTLTSLSYELSVNNPEIVAIKFEVVITLKKRTWRRTLIAENNNVDSQHTPTITP
ncbi:hypothetical protein FO440_07935 [Mucilaginibacter corticis]|uniref:Uncharacterized protein n=2 Tax=Mucilaginibacter corticis TaxID=2597670 RepID=A0A556MW45_9SPHI|nr:hypothetical protein FO440_07935 [Mucilaginibacter corticis]